MVSHRTYSRNPNHGLRQLIDAALGCLCQALKSSAGIAASLLYVLIAVNGLPQHSRNYEVMLAVGVAGVVVFGWHDQQDSAKSPSASEDGKAV